MRRICVLVLFVLSLLFPQTISADPICAFVGKIDFVGQALDIIVDFKGRGTVMGHGEASGKHEFRLELAADNLVTPLFKVSTELSSIVEVFEGKGAGDSKIRGKIRTHNSLINNKPPTKELSGRFEIHQGTLHINRLSFEGVSGDGSLKLASPHTLDLALRLSKIDMNDFLAFWFEDSSELTAEGSVAGEVKLTGPLKSPLLKASFLSEDGNVNNWEYDSVNLNMEGIYPVLKLADSTITKKDGFSFNVSGNFDLSDKKTLAEQFTALERTPLVSESDTSLEWTIKRKEHGDNLGTTEFKYFRRKGDKDDSSDEDTDMIGVERSIDF